MLHGKFSPLSHDLDICSSLFFILRLSYVVHLNLFLNVLLVSKCIQPFCCCNHHLHFVHTGLQECIFDRVHVINLYAFSLSSTVDTVNSVNEGIMKSNVILLQCIPGSQN